MSEGLEGGLLAHEVYLHVGVGVTQDYQKAVELYTKPADQGDATAQGNLGYCYEVGKGVGEDRQKAIELYRKAAPGYDFAKRRLEVLGVGR